MLQELNILALLKGEEHYVIVYTEDSQQEAVQAMRDWAADPRLSFSWFDAAVLARRLRQQRASPNFRPATPRDKQAEEHRSGPTPEL
ncbi:hypothetical protein HRbin36_00213 [bacterium HR36]|nr:hypothetical protein HRbin36_00213 [bacterium HR36]